MKTQTLQNIHTLFNQSKIPNINPEFFHHLAMTTSKYAEKSQYIIDSIKETTYLEWEEKLKVNMWDLELKNPIGLAAGFVKEPTGLQFWEAFWFGYMTIGWITKHPQKWNKKTRIYRFPDWVINGMWLPSIWIEDIVKRLSIRVRKNMMPEVPLFANLCNNLITPVNEKTNELKYLMEKLFPFVQAFEINISCPNQKWVCSISTQLENLLKDLKSYNETLAVKNNTSPRKLLLKISPLSTNELSGTCDIQDGIQEKLELIAQICNTHKIDWIIATNTQKEHTRDIKIITASWETIRWWASWKMIQEISLKTVEELRKILDKKIPIIWVWGVGFDKKWEEWQSAINMLNAWAQSLQIYSSFVFNVMTPYNIKKIILEKSPFPSYEG